MKRGKYIRTLKIRKLISTKMMNNKNGLGYKRTKEHRIKMIQGLRNKFKDKEYCDRIGNNFGHNSITHTQKVKDKIRNSVKIHNKLVKELKDNYKRKGYKVLSCFDIQPDLIIRKGNKIIAVELERNILNIIKKKEQFKRTNLFDKQIYFTIGVNNECKKR
jgi:hypothetical protein